MRSSAALLVTVLLAVSAVAGVGAAFPADDRVRAPSDLSESALSVSENSPSTPEHSFSFPESAHSMTSTVNQTASNATARDETKMHVSLRDDGNARWNVTARFALRNQNETNAFRELASTYENGNANAGPSAATFERIAERAAAETGREMEIENASRSARLGQNESVGVLSLSFTWTNFTQVEDSQLVMGDAFRFGSETWLPSLTGDQTLIIDAPPKYIVLDSPQNKGVINATRLRYEGPRSIEPAELSAAYEPRVEATTTTPGNFPDLSGPSGLVLLLFLFSAGGVGAYAWSQRRGADSVETPDGPGDDTSSAAPTRDGVAGVGEDDTEEDDEPATELLSDEERVLRLLRDNDGRMKQAQIVKETNWSNAKVSQLLSKMSDDDDVDKLRIGRENLITLPDEDVTDTE